MAALLPLGGRHQLQNRVNTSGSQEDTHGGNSVNTEHLQERQHFDRTEEQLEDQLQSQGGDKHGDPGLTEYIVRPWIQSVISGTQTLALECEARPLAITYKENIGTSSLSKYSPEIHLVHSLEQESPSLLTHTSSSPSTEFSPSMAHTADAREVSMELLSTSTKGRVRTNIMDQTWGTVATSCKFGIKEEEEEEGSQEDVVEEWGLEQCAYRRKINNKRSKRSSYGGMKNFTRSYFS